MKKKRTVQKACALLIGCCIAGSALLGQAEEWVWPSMGTGNGTWDASVGVFVWKDTFNVRNLQLRTDLSLAPGMRWHSIVRSNQEADSLKGGSPHFDENYLEGYGFRKDENGTLGMSLRVGTTRYLHFPYPDAIAVFDQVPGISDLTDGEKTGYSGALLTLDYAHKSGLGIHTSAIQWGFGRPSGQSLLENYFFYRQDVGKLHFETHVGDLALRPEPLGQYGKGYNVYLGAEAKGYTAGLLYEKIHNQPTYTGIMITFPLNETTKAMGRVAFDYDRTPQGLAAQIPLASGRLGTLSKTAPAGYTLVGESKAERLRTYWQNGQVRNFYEHYLSSWGEVDGKDTIVVIKEEPWYLQAEALVSPHTFSEGAKTWERDRQGPAQLSQKITYQFYKKNQQKK